MSHYRASLLFVCLGNICRSPVAEALCKSYVHTHNLPVHCDSAGLHGYHSGELPDKRTLKNCQQHGLNMDGLVSRKLKRDDFYQFDYLIAMDQPVFEKLNTMVNPSELKNKIKLFRYFETNTSETCVPDPYYGTDSDFELVYQICKRVMPELIQALVK